MMPLETGISFLHTVQVTRDIINTITLFLFIRSKLKVMFVPLYKTQSIMSFILIIFRLKYLLLKERDYIGKHLEERDELITMVVLKKI